MLGQVDIATVDWIVMDVFSFLNHHRFGVDSLRSHARLPEMIRSVSLLSGGFQGEMIKHKCVLLAEVIIDALAGGEGFEIR